MFGFGRFFKNDIYAIYDPEHERRQKIRRRTAVIGVLMSFVFLSFPVVRDFIPKWDAYRAAARTAEYLSMIRTTAILKHIPLEVRFILPDILEVHEASNCGPTANHKKLWDIRLSEFAEAVEFVDKNWVRQNVNPSEPIFSRYCYDPLFGSSVAAEGFARGSVYIAHRMSIQRPDEMVQIFLEGPSGNIQFD